jgi:hypothetical protein
MRCLAALILSGCCSAVSLAGEQPPPPALAQVSVETLRVTPTAAERAAQTALLQERITQRAAKEGRERQVRIAARRATGINLLRPVYQPDLGLLGNAHLYHVDPGVPANRLPGTVAAGLVPLPTPSAR